MFDWQDISLNNPMAYLDLNGELQRVIKALLMFMPRTEEVWVCANRFLSNNLYFKTTNTAFFLILCWILNSYYIIICYKLLKTVIIYVKKKLNRIKNSVEYPSEQANSSWRIQMLHLWGKTLSLHNIKFYLYLIQY